MNLAATRTADFWNGRRDLDVGSGLHAWRCFLAAALRLGGRRPGRLRSPRVWCRARRPFLRGLGGEWISEADAEVAWASRCWRCPHRIPLSLPLRRSDGASTGRARGWRARRRRWQQPDPRPPTRPDTPPRTRGCGGRIVRHQRVIGVLGNRPSVRVVRHPWHCLEQLKPRRGTGGAAGIHVHLVLLSRREFEWYLRVYLPRAHVIQRRGDTANEHRRPQERGSQRHAGGRGSNSPGSNRKSGSLFREPVSRP